MAETRERERGGGGEREREANREKYNEAQIEDLITLSSSFESNDYTFC